MCKQVVKVNTSCIREDIEYEVTYYMDRNSNPYLPFTNKYRTDVCLKNGCSKFLIVIGQNPSYCQTVNNSPFNIDNTCWNILKILKDLNYGGFYMLNTYPEINCLGKSFKAYKNNSFNLDQAIRLIDEHKSEKIILAFSRNKLPLDFCTKIIDYLNTNRLYCFHDGQKIIYHASTQSIKGQINNIQLKKVVKLIISKADKKNNTCNVKIII